MIDDTVLSLYQIPNPPMELVGKGGFGKVFRVFSKLDDRYYAIKRILITEKTTKGALHEIRILASIVHPHIIRYFHSWIEACPIDDEEQHDSDEEEEEDEEEYDRLVYQDNFYYFNIKMEYCQGTLRNYLTNRTAVHPEECYYLMTQIIDGIYFLHKSGIIHRDLKPENILISQYHPIHVKISDFGLAKVFHKDLSLTESTTYAGSFLYASPEQYNGEKYSFSTDIYSLGVMLVEIQYLFSTNMERIVILRDFKTHPHLLDPIHYRELIMDMTHLDPTRRPTIIQMRNVFFDQMLHHPIVICRDIIWDIVHHLPI